VGSTFENHTIFQANYGSKGISNKRNDRWNSLETSCRDYTIWFILILKLVQVRQNSSQSDFI